MLRVGLVGIGFMGWIHYLAYRRSPTAQLVAFSSREPLKRKGDWRSIRGNFGPPGEAIDVSGLRVYETIESLIDDPAIDVIDICLPPHLHVDVAVSALEHGKHVLCEKPFALNVADCDRVLAAAKQHDRMVLIAHVLPFIGPFAYAAELAQSKKYGKAIGGYFKRTISNPDWIPDFFDPQRVGGPLIDLNVHDAHFVRMIFGPAKHVTAVGRTVEGSGKTSSKASSTVAKYAHVLYGFDDGSLSVASTGGVVDAPGRPFTHGFELHFEEATLQYEFSAFSDTCETMPLKVLTRSGEVIRPTLPIGDDITAFELEIAEMVRSLQSGSPAPQLCPQIARDAIHLAECIQKSVIERRTVSV